MTLVGELIIGYWTVLCVFVFFVSKDMFFNWFKYKPVPWAGAPLNNLKNKSQIDIICK